MDTEVLQVIALFSAIASRVVELLFKPIFDKLNWDKFWLAYIAVLVGAALAYYTGRDAFPALLPPMGRVLTAVLGGVGPGLIYDLLDGGGKIVAQYLNMRVLTAEK